MVKAIVLLGYRNAGKDSVCKYLQEQFPQQFYNAKFGEYNKSVAAELMRVPRSFLEDKVWREQPFIDDLSALDILNSLFYLSEQNEKLQEKIKTSCLSSIPTDKIPVFTDVRRGREFGAVLDKYGVGETAVFWLDTGCATPSEGDEELEDLLKSTTIDDVFHCSIATNAESIIARLRLDTICRKIPVLHLYLNRFKFAQLNLPTYEPLASLHESCVEFGQALGLQSFAIGSLFQLVLNELPTDKITFAPITTDSKMVFVFDNHSQLLGELREKAVLRLHTSDEITANWALDYFTKEEIITHE